MSDEIGARLINERNRLGMSQIDIAKIVGVRREMWARYESGSEPGAKVLSKMHQIGIDVLYVLTGQRNPSMNNKQYLVAEDRVNYVGPSQQETALLNNYREADESGKEVIEKTSAAFAAASKEKKRTG